MEGVFRRLDVISSFPLTFQFENIPNKEMFKKIIGEDVEIELLTIDNKGRLTIGLFMEEGSVRDFKRISRINERLHEDALPNAQVYLIYDSPSAMIEDVLPFKLHKSIRMSNLADLSSKSSKVRIYDHKKQAVDVGALNFKEKSTTMFYTTRLLTQILHNATTKSYKVSIFKTISTPTTGI